MIKNNLLRHYNYINGNQELIILFVPLHRYKKYCLNNNYISSFTISAQYSQNNIGRVE